MLFAYMFIESLISCAGGRHNIPPPTLTFTFDLLTLKVVSESLWRDVPLCQF